MKFTPNSKRRNLNRNYMHLKLQILPLRKITKALKKWLRNKSSEKIRKKMVKIKWKQRLICWKCWLIKVLWLELNNLGSRTRSARALFRVSTAVTVIPLISGIHSTKSESTYRLLTWKRLRCSNINTKSMMHGHMLRTLTLLTPVQSKSMQRRQQRLSRPKWAMI